MPAPGIRLLIGSTVAIGPGKAALLSAIQETGSISAAARSMGMSYRRAWLLVDRMNADFVTPVVERTTGGRGGGGAALTPVGLEALTRYREIEAKALASVASELANFAPLLHPAALQTIDRDDEET